MANCSSCGADLGSGQRFCTGCGRQVDASGPPDKENSSLSAAVESASLTALLGDLEYGTVDAKYLALMRLLTGERSVLLQAYPALLGCLERTSSLEPTERAVGGLASAVRFLSAVGIAWCRDLDSTVDYEGKAYLVLQEYLPVNYIHCQDDTQEARYNDGLGISFPWLKGHTGYPGDVGFASLEAMSHYRDLSVVGASLLNFLRNLVSDNSSAVTFREQGDRRIQLVYALSALNCGEAREALGYYASEMSDTGVGRAARIALNNWGQLSFLDMIDMDPTLPRPSKNSRGSAKEPAGSRTNLTEGQAPAGSGEQKSRILAGILGIFFGAFGVHNFYLGYTKKATWQLVMSIIGIVTLCIVIGWGLLLVTSVWGLVEGIMILVGAVNNDANGVALGS